MSLLLRFLAAIILVFSFNFVEFPPFEKFTAQLFAISGYYFNWFYQESFSGYSVGIPLKNGGDLARVNTSCTYQAVFFGLLPFIINFRSIRKTILGLFIAAFSVLFLNVVRFHIRVILMNFGFDVIFSESVTYISGFIAAFAVGIWYYNKFNKCKSIQINNLSENSAEQLAV